jgi:D-sedoheptulose 7-phosphate isomerase
MSDAGEHVGEARDFRRELYPFLRGANHGADRPLDALLSEVRSSTLQKSRDIAELRGRLAAEYRDMLVRIATEMAAAFAAGGKLLAFGNGGSATDAQDAATDCMVPPFAHWRALPALALVNEIAIVTGVANDVGFENAYLRQVIAMGERGDIAMGFSTSGGSPNIVAALAEAHRRGLLTIALTGYDGGVLARSTEVDYCLVVRGEHIPRIQEGHATLWHALLELVQESMSTALRGATA